MSKKSTNTLIAVPVRVLLCEVYSDRDGRLRVPCLGRGTGLHDISLLHALGPRLTQQLLDAQLSPTSNAEKALNSFDMRGVAYLLWQIEAFSCPSIEFHW